MENNKIEETETEELKEKKFDKFDKFEFGFHLFILIISPAPFLYLLDESFIVFIAFLLTYIFGFIACLSLNKLIKIFKKD